MAMLDPILNKLPADKRAKAEALIASARNHTGPVGAMVSSALKPIMAKAKQGAKNKGVATVRPSRTLGGTFRHLCIVGLNKSELLLHGEANSLSAPTWQELTDDTMRNHLGMLFFAPRGLDGLPVDPYLFLTGDTIVSSGAEKEEGSSDNSTDMAHEQLAGYALLDGCRISPAAPNTLNIVLAADVLFHWDVKDNYILPTTAITWVRDVEQIMKTYPRTTRANIYTQWETDLLPPNDRITIHKLRDIPLDTSMWLNQPTWQEAHGNHILVGALILAALVGSALWLQQGKLNTLDNDLRAIEQEIPKEGRFAELGKAISEQEKMLNTREMFFLTVKDTARAIEQADIKFDNFEIKTPDPQEPATQLVISIETQKNAYQGWLEEEPVARQLLMNSALLSGVRKPPGTTFRLEGLVDLTPLIREYKQLAAGKNLASSSAGFNSTTRATPVADEAAEADTSATTPETAAPEETPTTTEGSAQ